MNIQAAFPKTHLSATTLLCSGSIRHAKRLREARAGLVCGDSMNEVWKQASSRLSAASIHFPAWHKTGNAEEKLKPSIWRLLIQASTSWTVPYSVTERSFHCQMPPPDFNGTHGCCNNKNPRTTNQKDPASKN